jgi:hypothetical protein
MYGATLFASGSLTKATKENDREKEHHLSFRSCSCDCSFCCIDERGIDCVCAKFQLVDDDGPGEYQQFETTASPFKAKAESGGGND